PRPTRRSSDPATGTHQVTATSSADTTKTASATVTVSYSTTTCTASSGGVNICQPANGSTVSSPVKIVAAAKGNAPIQTMKIYLDGASVYTVQASEINTSLTIASGAHRITVKGWDTGGVVYSSTINITVGTSSGV